MPQTRWTIQGARRTIVRRPGAVQMIARRGRGTCCAFAPGAIGPGAMTNHRRRSCDGQMPQAGPMTLTGAGTACTWIGATAGRFGPADHWRFAASGCCAAEGWTYVRREEVSCPVASSVTSDPPSAAAIIQPAVRLASAPLAACARKRRGRAAGGPDGTSVAGCPVTGSPVPGGPAVAGCSCVGSSSYTWTPNFLPA